MTKLEYSEKPGSTSGMSADGGLLLRLLRSAPPKELATESVKALEELASFHGLCGVLQERLAQSSVSSVFENILAEQAVRSGLQLQAAAEIIRALNEQNIRAVFVKGVALAATVYATGVRRFGDLDLLIAPADFKSAHAVLLKLGFAVDEKTRGNPIELGYVRERLPGFKIFVDLHWGFASDEGFQAPVRVPVESILSRRRTIGELPVPEAEDMLLLAAVNLGRKAAEPLVLIVDFARLSQLPLNWQQISQRAQEWRVRTPLWLGLILAQKICGLSAPTDVIASLEPAPWKQRWLLSLLDERALCTVDKQMTWRYRVLFKLLCADSFWGLWRLGTGLLKRLARKASLRKTVPEVGAG